MKKDEIKTLADGNTASYPEGTVFQNVPLTAIMYDKQNTLDAVNARVAEVIDGAPSAFDTLKEIAEWIAAHPDKAVVSAVEQGSSNGKVKVTTTPTSTGSAATAEFDAYVHPTAEVVAAGLYNVGRDAYGHVEIGAAVDTAGWDTAAAWVTANGEHAEWTYETVLDHHNAWDLAAQFGVDAWNTVNLNSAAWASGEENLVTGADATVGLTLTNKVIGIDTNRYIPYGEDVQKWDGTYGTVLAKSAEWSAASSGEANLVTGAAGGLTVDDKAVKPDADHTIPLGTTMASLAVVDTTVRANSAAWASGEANLVTGATGGLTVDTELRVTTAEGYVIPTTDVTSQWQNTTDNAPTATDTDLGLYIESNILKASEGRFIPTTEQLGWYQDTYTVVTGASGKWNSTADTVSGKSGAWENTASTVSGKSATWDDTTTTVSANSANWEAGSNVTGVVAADGLTLTDKAVGVDNTHVIPTKTEQTKVVGAADEVIAGSAYWYAGAQVTGVVTADGLTLTDGVVGVASTQFIPYMADGQKWEGTYSTVNEKSATWEDTAAVVALNSGDWGEGEKNKVTGAINGLTVNDSLQVTPDSDHVLPTTGEYNQVVAAAQKVTSTSAAWDNVGSTVTANSANWIGTYNTVSANSAAWASGEANEVTGAAGGLQISNKNVVPDDGYVIPTTEQTGNWDNAYNTVTAHESEWGAVTGAYGELVVNDDKQVRVSDGYTIPQDTQVAYWDNIGYTVEWRETAWDAADEHATQDKTAAAVALAAITNAGDVEDIKNALIAYFSALNP